MTEAPGIWLADLLMCLTRLGPLDEAQAGAVARMLGLAPLAAGDAAPDLDEEAGDTGGEAGSGGATEIDDRVEPEKEVSPHVDDAPRRTRLRPTGRPSRGKVRPWEAVEALARHGGGAGGDGLPHEPLWNPRWTRELVAAAVASTGAGGGVDEARLIDTVARCRPVTELPRVSKRTLRHGAQVLADVGEAMTPYARDRAALVAAIREVAGRRTTTVLRFDGAPLRGAGVSGRPTWGPYRPPDPGTPVVALTDLGIGGPPLDPGRPSPGEWLSLADILARRDSHLVAIVPYPAHRWPRELERVITILPWDRPVTVSHVLDLVLEGERR